MSKIVVAGIGTEVGKTVAAAVLATALNADYWKPIETGVDVESDSRRMRELLNAAEHHVFSPAYSLQAPLSPHHAARLENVTIDPSTICIPKTDRPLVIESVGGVYVPLTNNFLTIDLLGKWKLPWVVVSKHYLGSINHTLLTIDALKRRGVWIKGIIFNGEINKDSEDVILEMTGLSSMGRLLPEPVINSSVIKRYAKEWNLHF